MDFKQFYLSQQGRVNRKQFWLWLVLPLTVLSILLGFIDLRTGTYNPELRIGLYTSLFLTFPYLLGQIWLFVRPALYGKERKAVWPFILISSPLFVQILLFLLHLH